MAWPLACGTTVSSPDATDTDGDGLSDRDELMIYGTSPLLADTDGDGWSDYAEVIDFGFDPQHAPYRFNPLVADLPELAIVFTSPPLLTIQMTDMTGETWTVETTLTSEQTLSVTTSVTTTDTQSETVSTPTTVTDEEQVSETIVVAPSSGAAVVMPPDLLLSLTPPDMSGGAGAMGSVLDRPWGDAGPEEDEDAGDGGHAHDAGDGGSADAGSADAGSAVVGKSGAELDVTRELTVTRARAVSSSFEPSTTVETAIAVTEEQTDQYREALSQAESYARTHDVTAISGVLLLTATIENRGNVAFRVINLLLTAMMMNTPPAITPIGNLTIDAEPYSDFQPFSLAPGETTAPMNFVRLALTLEAVQAIFDDPQALLVQVGLFEIDDATGRAFAFTISEARAKTALIWIDYGDLRPSEWFAVATKADPSRTYITVRKALEDVLRIPFEAPRGAGLVSLRDVGRRNSIAGQWAVSLEKDDGSGMIVRRDFDPAFEPYDFGDIQLHASDVLRLTYIRP